MKLGFAMRPTAVLALALQTGLVSGRAVQLHHAVSPETQRVIGNNLLAYPRRPQLPVLFTRPAGTHDLTGFAAFGDSYSAGIGTGFEGKEDDCRHGLHSHAALVAADLLAGQGGRNATTFQFLSCTGATTQQILSGSQDSQIDALNASLPIDFALLSIGGNDLGFFEVMNACVFRFYNFYSGTCESALEHTRAQIESDEFENRLLIVITEILDRVRWEKKPSFFITVTGYARFFNDVTDECDDMSFGVWWNGPRLKKDLRSNMNAMVLTVNAKIRRTVDLINSQFTQNKLVFVDYDEEFEGHRFCENNVTEPDYNRSDTWFFLVGGPDNARNETRKDHVPEFSALAPYSPLVDPVSCLEPAQRSGDWGELALCYMAMSKRQDPTLRLARGDFVAENSMWYVPTYYGKTFHPRSLGQETIKNRIYEVWRTLE
ncbi:SGNH hydrolase [Durotheca rogersii]|uniref:SGNH hydrolase n=1 Tax=Durotheca rogersii TaxID=419775 RepID=UPI00222037B2|nr:SGNH hydrolase [Durotheca rogersii]KAI5863220.1 SGNH hydrolase [Durotheca rogersii]